MRSDCPRISIKSWNASVTCQNTENALSQARMRVGKQLRQACESRMAAHKSTGCQHAWDPTSLRRQT